MMVPATSLERGSSCKCLWKVHPVPGLSFDFSCEADSLHLVGTYLVPATSGYIQCLENTSSRGACASSRLPT
jgi:hypothetical protein